MSYAMEVMNFFWKACPICQLPKWQNSFLCTQCCKLIGPPNIESQQIQGMQVYSFYRWTHINHGPLSRLVYALKGGESLSALDIFFTENIGLHLKFAIQNLSTFSLVPSPSKRPGVRDHSLALTEAVAHKIHCPIKNILLREDLSSQRNLSRKERFHRRMTLEPGVSCPSQVLFVDDVLTTGSTAKAAYEALGRPKNFKVLCFVERPFEASCH